MFPPYEVPEEIRKRLMGENSIANQAIDSTQLPPSPGEQTEAADEAIDTTTNAHTPPAVAPAPDTPPEVAIANSQTNQQASGETPAAVPPEPRPETANGLPVVHMPENPAARMAPKPAQQGTPRAPPPEPPVNGVQPTSPGAAPGAPPEPGFYERGAALLAARARDRENVNRWNLGEGLKEAFAIARGQHYGGKPYGGPLEEAGVEKDQASSLAQIRDYLARQRQQREDALSGRLKESEILKNNAEAARAAREKPATGMEDVPGLIDVLSSPAFAEKRRQFGYGTPEELKTSTSPGSFVSGAIRGATGEQIGPNKLRALPQDKEALKELRSSWEGERASEMSKDATIQAATTAASIQRGFQESQADKAAAAQLADELSKQHIPETMATIAALRKALDEHGGELPGVGPIAGRSLPMGIDTFLRSDEGNKYRNQVQQLQEAHRVAVTGAGAGPTELAMLNQTIMSPTDSPAVFRQKLDAFNDLVSARFQGMKARATGKQLDDYFGNLQNVKQREVPKQSAPGGPKVGDKRPMKSGGTATWNGQKWVLGG